MMRQLLLILVLAATWLDAGFSGGEEPLRAPMKLVQCGAIYRDDFSSGGCSRSIRRQIR